MRTEDSILSVENISCLMLGKKAGVAQNVKNDRACIKKEASLECCAWHVHVASRALILLGKPR